MAIRAKYEDVAHLLPPGFEPPARPSKYRNQATIYRDIQFHSRLEAKRAADLDLGIVGKTVLWWTRQVPFWLGPASIKIVVDFLVRTPGSIHVEEVKGYETPRFKDIRKLWVAHGPCNLYIIKRFDIEVIEPRKQGA